MSEYVYDSIRFNIPPELGSVVIHKDQRYVLIEVEPYIRRDGCLSQVLHWRTHCPECGKVFIATSALRNRYINRRCPAHRKRGKPVSNVTTSAKRCQSKRSSHRKKTSRRR